MAVDTYVLQLDYGGAAARRRSRRCVVKTKVLAGHQEHAQAWSARWPSNPWPCSSHASRTAHLHASQAAAGRQHTRQYAHTGFKHAISIGCLVPPSWGSFASREASVQARQRQAMLKSRTHVLDARHRLAHFADAAGVGHAVAAAAVELLLCMQPRPLLQQHKPAGQGQA